MRLVLMCGFNEAEYLSCATHVSSPEEHLLSGCWLLSCLWLSGTEVHNVFLLLQGRRRPQWTWRLLAWTQRLR